MEAYIDKHLEDPSDHRDDVGLLTFDYFLKIYRTAMVWNRVKFEEKKKEQIKERREALKAEDMERWREIYQEMASLDEECLQDVLEQILARVGLTEKHF